MGTLLRGHKLWPSGIIKIIFLVSVQFSMHPLKLMITSTTAHSHYLSDNVSKRDLLWVSIEYVECVYESTQCYLFAQTIELFFLYSSTPYFSFLLDLN
jgi:hypothetical protein